MTKDVAWFPGHSAVDALAAMKALGLTLLHPERREVQAFSSSGDAIRELTEPAAMELLARGAAGVTLWLAPDHDLFVSLVDGVLCASFDGFGRSEQQELLERFVAVGLRPVVRREDESPPQ